MRKIINVVMPLLLLFNSCKQLPPYTSKQDLIGSWHCKSVEIVTADNNYSHFPMQKYGFASFSLYEDSTYSFTMEILKDIVMEKEIIGNIYSKTILQAGYKNFRRGYYFVSKNIITFMDAYRIKVNEENYSFNVRDLITQFIDKDNKHWKIFWVKVI